MIHALNVEEQNFTILFPKCVVADIFPSLSLTICFLLECLVSFRVFLELQVAIKYTVRLCCNFTVTYCKKKSSKIPYI